MPDDQTPKEITGRCYCGAITVRAIRPPRDIAYCHCADCRRVTGAPVAAFAAFDEGAVMVSPSEGRCVTVNPGVTRTFCESCGSPVTGRYDYLPGQVYIPLGILDQADALAPRRHAHYGCRLPWLHIEDDLERSTGSARAALNQSALNQAALNPSAAVNGAPFELKPLDPDPGFGREIAGIDLATAADPEVFRHVYQAFLDHQLILFRDQDVSPDVQVAFARNFGEVQVHVMNQYHAYPDHPEIYVLTNRGEDGRPNGKHPDKGTLHWHTDGSWRETTGQATMMVAEVVPEEGGETHFADMYGAWDRLPEDWKARLSGLRAFHNLDFSRSRRHGEDPMTEAQKAQVPPVPHPIARTHPETGRRCVFAGDHAEWVDGMDYDKGRALIEEVNRLAAPEDRIYRHAWKPGEVMVWDNRCLLHRATGFDTAAAIRVMRRCTVLGDRPY